MADTTLTGRLKRLFSGSTIVRNIGGRKLKVMDTSKIQAGAQNTLVDRFQKLHSNMANHSYNELLQVQQLRLGLFRDYESMDSDSIVASALDIYSDESTMKNEYGKILGIRTSNDQIHDILHNLFYDIINIEFNLWPWVRNMVKYGDFFLKLDVQDKYGVMNVQPMSAYDISRLEGHDPENPQMVQFEYIPQQGSGHVGAKHSARGRESTLLENYEVAHFRLLSDSNFVPYGRSILEGGRKVWKQLTLMEDAMLIHRIMRAPEKRIFKLDIGNIPPAEVDNYMQQVINKMKKAPIMDEKTGEYNLRYNIQNLTEDFFLPVRGGDSGTNIESLPGLQYEATDDVEYLKNKLLASLHVPKAFLGYEEGLGSKATLAAEDVRFARTIERIQRILVSELQKIAVVHLYSQGFRDQELVNFELNLTNPSTIYEQEKIELWNNKTSLAESMIRDGLVSSEWIYKNIFGFTDDQIKEQDEQITFDYKTKFRRSQIESEGNDPAKSGESQVTPSVLAMGRTGHELNDEGGSEEGGQPGAGRPKEADKYGQDSGTRGRDPIGSHDMGKAYSTKSLAKYENMLKHFGDSAKELLNESGELEKEYKSEVDSLNTKKK
jgi:hypothetical protein